MTPPTPKYPIQATVFQSGSPLQGPSLSQSPSPVNKKSDIKPELIYQQMTLVVINNIFKPESCEDKPWENILVAYLTEKGSANDFNRLLSSDFSLAKFKAKLADSAQSPFKFDEELHELIYTGRMRDRVVHYEAVWRTILQQAANEGKKKLCFKVRDKA
jgi:hypothetical protein